MQCTSQQSSLQELWAHTPSAQPELISSACQHHVTVLIYEFKETSLHSSCCVIWRIKSLCACLDGCNAVRCKLAAESSVSSLWYPFVSGWQWCVYYRKKQTSSFSFPATKMKMTAAIDSSLTALFPAVPKSNVFMHKTQNSSLRSTKRTVVDCEYLWKKIGNSQQIEPSISFLSGQHLFFKEKIKVLLLQKVVLVF